MCPPAAHLAATQASELTASSTSIPSIVPNDAVSRAAYLHAASNLHPSILNHSLRVWLYAQAISLRESTIWTSSPDQTTLLFTACILHDIGTSSTHDGPQRFEIEGADVAESLLLNHGFSAAEAHDVWTAIALHSTPQIAERISPLSRLVRIAVVVDFKSPTYLPTMTTEAEIQDFEAKLPRDGIEKILGDVVADQALRQPGKAPKACWPGGLYRFKLANPEWEGVNGEF